MSASSGKGWDSKDQDLLPLPDPRVQLQKTSRVGLKNSSFSDSALDWIRPSDHDVLVRVSWAFWPEGEGALAELSHALSLCSISEGSPTDFAERVAAVLLRKATVASSSNSSLPTTAWETPFFRLPVEARFVLACLHGDSRWSWARISRVFVLLLKERDLRSTAKADLSDLQSWVARLAWSSRVELYWERGKGLFAHPSSGGSRTLQLSCPEYDSRAPWSQRFLDEEIASQERLFLQNHLMVCDSCRLVLERTRTLFAELDIELKRIRKENTPVGGGAAETAGRNALSELNLLRRSMVRQSSLSLRESLRIHFRAAENRRVLWIALGILGLAFLQQFFL